MNFQFYPPMTPPKEYRQMMNDVIDHCVNKQGTSQRRKIRREKKREREKEKERERERKREIERERERM